MNRLLSRILIVMGILSVPCTGFAQKIQPIRYITFDDNRNPISPAVLAATGGTLRENDLATGKYLQCQPGEEASHIILGAVTPMSAMTLEFLFRIDPDNNQGSSMLFRLHDNSFIVNIALPVIDFTTFTQTTSGEISTDYMGVQLKGEGKRGVDHYLDGKWHHIVFKWDGTSGKKEIWIDGELPEGFSRQLESRGRLMATKWRPEGSTFQLNAGCRYGCFWGDLDEIALYDRFVPAPYHIRHALDALDDGKPYAFDVEKTATPRQLKPAVVDQPKTTIDLREFPPGYPGELPDAIEQVRRAPSPRYRSGHKLIRNFNWMEPRYFAGWQTEGWSQQDAIDRSVTLQALLVRRWHYSLNLSNTAAFYEIKGDGRGKTFLSAWIDLANAHPEWPLTATTFWGQVAPGTINEGNHIPNILRQDLAPSFYLSDAAGKVLTGSNGQRSFSPAAPASALVTDGKAQAFYISHILDRLKRPLNMINENGECPPPPYPIATLEADARVMRDKQNYGNRSWESYQALRKTAFRQAYRDVFLKSDPRLANTIFSWYAVDGGPQARFEWSEARKIGTPINGQYYSTPDFYPRWPENWEKWNGPWHGWAWLEACRKTEIAQGDKLFSPFVAAGWDKNPEKNVRPSQWLGLLKCTGVIGAAFYYTGVFNEHAVNHFPLPKNYAWQALTPAYAQAITSHYEDILRNGNLLLDAKGEPILRHPVSDPRVLVAIRKHATQPRYVIAAVINPYSNQKGNIPDQKPIRLNVEGSELQLVVRRQGSVYIFDKTDPYAPVITMPDHWHETGHPLHWSQDWIFEAEVFDQGKQVAARTETPAGKAAGDYTEFTSYIAPTGADASLEYQLEHGEEKTVTYHLSVRMHSLDAKATGVAIYFDDVLAGKLNCGKSQNWEWVDGKKCMLGQKISISVPPGAPHSIRLQPLNKSLALDKFRLQRI